ncbi:hypothetical protein AB0E27_32280 [Streptomyces sparsogenes]|uniref:hypothetical protein n=1 Tax=Streptomyces sparsogenes TaxID=67365 RepID=UPI0033F906B3
MELAVHGDLKPEDWLERFQRAADASLRSQFATEEDRGILRELAFDSGEDGVWATASFSMASHPGITFIRSQRVMPDLSSEEDPEFAAILLGIHLIEWFYTEATGKTPDADGVIRN